LSAYDVAVIGAGAAGMMNAARLGRAGLRVVLIDHASKLAEKIRISGGGRCNFTNLDVSARNFICTNPHFPKAALSAYTPQDFLREIQAHGIAWHEKHRGQLFCDTSSQAIIDWLRLQCDQAQVDWRMGCTVLDVQKVAEGFLLGTESGPIISGRLVVATGGMALPQVGATDFGLKLARQFGLRIIEPRPALVPLKFDSEQWKGLTELAGVALPVDLGVSSVFGGKQGVVRFAEDMLFTHRGLSGPGILQISSYWRPGQPLRINLVPSVDLEQFLIDNKQQTKQSLLAALGLHLPKRLAQYWAGELGTRRLAEMPDRQVRELARQIAGWQITPSGTEGYKKAEVMSGGVDTSELNQRSFESNRVPGLHFIGEVVDVTGWLGGYNFQWAWSCAVSCASAISSLSSSVSKQD